MSDSFGDAGVSGVGSSAARAESGIVSYSSSYGERSEVEGLPASRIG